MRTKQHPNFIHFSWPTSTEISESKAPSHAGHKVPSTITDLRNCTYTKWHDF